MFYQREKKGLFFISSDDIIWEFWPFEWTFHKNKFYWNMREDLIDKKYLNYKYNIWIFKEKMYTITEKWLIEITNL